MPGHRTAGNLPLTSLERGERGEWLAARDFPGGDLRGTPGASVRFLRPSAGATPLVLERAQVGRAAEVAHLAENPLAALDQVGRGPIRVQSQRIRQHGR